VTAGTDRDDDAIVQPALADSRPRWRRLAAPAAVAGAAVLG